MQHEVDRNQQWARRWWRSCDSRAKVHLSLMILLFAPAPSPVASWTLDPYFVCSVLVLIGFSDLMWQDQPRGHPSGPCSGLGVSPWLIPPHLVVKSLITQAPKYCNIEILRRLSRLPVLCNSWCSQPCLARPCLSGLAFSSIVDGFTIVNFRRFKSKL